MSADPLRTFHHFIYRARPGTVFVYHEGFLWLDRNKSFVINNVRFLDPQSDLTEGLGRMAWQAYKDGKVLLVQKRNGPGQYEYRAVKRKETKT